MFDVRIKNETFDYPNMRFLKEKGFKSGVTYTVVEVVGQKLLIADKESGEMIELFPRNCLFIKE